MRVISTSDLLFIRGSSCLSTDILLNSHVDQFYIFCFSLLFGLCIIVDGASDVLLVEL